MVKVQDIRSRTKRTNGTRKLSQIKYIVRHHSATTTGNFDTFWRHWSGALGWGTGGYHEIILRDGTVQLCYDPHEITNGARGFNTPCYHICLVGNGSFTEAQERAWEQRVKYNMKRLGISVNNVKGHRELPGQSTTCPGINMSTVRSRIKNDKPTSSRNYLLNGDTGKAVKTLQENLIWLGYNVGKYGADGVYGDSTVSAVKEFQHDYGLTVDGVYGVASKSVMEKAIKETEEMKKEIDELKKNVAELRQELAKKQDKPSNSPAPSASHKDAWDWAENEGLMNGKNPHHYITREQVATILYRQGGD